MANDETFLIENWNINFYPFSIPKWLHVNYENFTTNIESAYGNLIKNE